MAPTVRRPAPFVNPLDAAAAKPMLGRLPSRPFLPAVRDADPMPYSSLRDFMDRLERSGRLVRVKTPVSPVLEMTEIHTRPLAQQGPAVLFENVVRPDGSRYEMPVLINLFGTVERVAWGMDREPHQLRGVGETLAFLRQPEPPGGFREALELIPLAKTVLSMKPKTVSSAPCQEVVLKGDDIDLGRLPIQGCWPGEPAPLITWPLVVTKGPGKKREDDFNLGIYRMQVTGRNTTLMRWLKHRGGAQHHRRWAASGKREPLPAAAVLGRTPAPSWPPSRRCRTPCRNTSSPGRCAAARSSWSIARPSC